MQIGSMGSDQHLQSILAEMARARELVMQLGAHIEHPTPDEFCKSVPKILSCIEKAIQSAKLHSSNVQRDSECSRNEERQNGSNKAFLYQQKEMMFKKRKTMPKRTIQVSLEGPYDDGYIWRKYGQKDILGAKHPRGYYRCTYRHTRGCLATKQVQRSDSDPQLFDVTYHGIHSCVPKHQNVIPGSITSAQLVQRQNQAKDLETCGHAQQKNQDHFLLSIQASNTVKSEELDCSTNKESLMSFSTRSATVVDSIFTPTSILESVYISTPMCGMSNDETEDKKTFTFNLESTRVNDTPSSPSALYFSPSVCTMSSSEEECKLQDFELEPPETLFLTSSACYSPDFYSNFDPDLFDPSS